MIPHELEASTIDLPHVDCYRIVVITGTQLRHDRFALRLQAEFPGLVVAWLQVGARKPRQALVERRGQLIARVWRRLTNKLSPQPPQLPSQQTVEQRLFGKEIKRLKEAAYITPTAVKDPNSMDVIAAIRALDPYFILTAGGAIYGKELRACARGLALNQHDGWCPEYRGTATVYWALYHRDLPKISNTIHILTDGMDSGPILRRSSACLAVDDTAESCFARSVALGTELMCETVHDLIQTKRAQIFRQPQFAGYTYVNKQMTKDIKRLIANDLQQGLIEKDLNERKRF